MNSKEQKATNLAIDLQLDKEVRKICKKFVKCWSFWREEVIKRTKRNKYGKHYFQVLERDNFECQNCHQKTHLVIHHLNGNHEDNRIENLLTLCHRCHRIVHLGALVIGCLPPYGRIYNLAMIIVNSRQQENDISI